MGSNQNVFSIASSAFRTTITDASFIERYLKKEKFFNRGIYNATKSKVFKKNKSNGDQTIPVGRGKGLQKRVETTSRQTRKTWEKGSYFTDTSSRYQQSRIHLGLWSRIHRSSDGSLPKEIITAKSEQIQSGDRDAIESYTTPSRGVRKCFITVFTASAKIAGRSLGFFKDYSQCPYRCKSTVLSVKELSKNTHAGTDTLGKKNDPKVQERVIRQVKDLFGKPNSKKIITKNTAYVLDYDIAEKLYSLPELIFHRFQAVYDKVSDNCIEKSRIVWCVPYTIVALERIFFGELIDNVKNHSLRYDRTIYPIGLTNYQIGKKCVQTLRDTFSIGPHGLAIYSLDFSKFDSTVPQWSKDVFFSMLKPLIEMDSAQSKVYDYLRIYVKYTPFVYKNELIIKQKGISSGLLITNLFDSWLNLTIHNFVHIIQSHYPELIGPINRGEVTPYNIIMDPERVKYDSISSLPQVRVMGDDTLILCDEQTLTLHNSVCKMLGMKVTTKLITDKPNEPIFFLGRYWDVNARPYQTEEYIALRIVYTRWYDEKLLPFPLEKLHLYRVLSVCLPLLGGKEFLDKYLADWEPYKVFSSSDEGFVFMKDYIDKEFQYKPRQKAFNIDDY